MDRFYVSYFRLSFVLWKCATILKFANEFEFIWSFGKKTILLMVQRCNRITVVILIGTIPPINLLIWIVTSTSTDRQAIYRPLVEHFIHAGIFELICYSIQVHARCKYFTSLCDSSSPTNKQTDHLHNVKKWLLCFAELLEHWANNRFFMWFSVVLYSGGVDSDYVEKIRQSMYITLVLCENESSIFKWYEISPNAISV